MRKYEFEKFKILTENQVKRWVNKGEDDLKDMMILWISEHNAHHSFTGWQLGELWSLICPK